MNINEQNCKIKYSQEFVSHIASPKLSNSLIIILREVFRKNVAVDLFFSNSSGQCFIAVQFFANWLQC